MGGRRYAPPHPGPLPEGEGESSVASRRIRGSGGQLERRDAKGAEKELFTGREQIGLLHCQGPRAARRGRVSGANWGGGTLAGGREVIIGQLCGHEDYADLFQERPILLGFRAAQVRITNFDLWPPRPSTVDRGLPARRRLGEGGWTPACPAFLHHFCTVPASLFAPCLLQLSLH